MRMKRIIFFLCFGFLFLGVVPAQTKKSVSRKKATLTLSRQRNSITAKNRIKKVQYKKYRKSNRKSSFSDNTISIASLKSRRDQLQRKIVQNEAQLRNTNKNVKSQLTGLAVLTGQIDKQKKYMREIQLQIDSLSQNIHMLSNRYDVLSKQLDERRQRYRRSLLYLYRNKGIENKLLFIFSAKNFSQMMRRYRYVREYSKFQQIQGQLIQKKQEQVTQAKTDLVKTQSNKHQMLNVQQNENVKLTKQQGERQETVVSLQKKQKQIQSVIASSRREMIQLNSKIDYYVRLAIEKERKRREAEARAREAERKQAMAAEQVRKKNEIETSKRNSAKVAISSSKKSTRGGASDLSSRHNEVSISTFQMNDKDYVLDKNFSSNQGRLPMPITGGYVISAHFGSYSLEGLKGVHLNNRGINITGRSGAQARCIFPGEVSAVFSLGGLVNVLVRHGSYISVYCNLSSASVHQGQSIGARTILGPVAHDASGNCTLHFQLRKETATLNPESWLAH